LQISYQFFKWRWVLERIFLKYIQKLLSLILEIAFCEFFGVFLGVLRIYDPPIHQSSPDSNSSSGDLIPSLMVSRIPGIDNRYIVSWTEDQSSSETRTALFRFPVIRIGTCDSAVSSIRRYRFARAWLAVNILIFLSYAKTYV